MSSVDSGEIIALLWLLLATQIDSWLWVVPAVLGVMRLVQACIDAYRIRSKPR